MRVTLRNSVDRGLQNIQHAQERLFELENRVATGKRITRPSDDPTGIARAGAAEQPQAGGATLA